MKLQLIEVEEFTSKKTGVVSYQAIVMGKFSNYGKIQSGTATLNVTYEQYQELKKYENKIIDFDFVIPQPQFPLTMKSYKVA